MATDRRTIDYRFRPWRGPPRVRSLWIDEALARESGEAPQVFAGDVKADVCIVGGGFAGLWTAIRLREFDSNARIVIMEADLCGSGASGRNSGGTGHWWSKLPTLLKALGKDDATFLLNKSVAILDDMADFIAQHGIQCDLRRGSATWTATAPAQLGAWDTMLRAADKIGIDPPYTVLTAEELRAQFGSGPYYAGVVEGGALRIQPAVLARGLRRIACERNVEIFENSPVTQVRSDAAGVSVVTGHGRVLAQQVVLAANAWMAHLPEFRSSVMVVSSDIIATDPIADVLKERGLANRPGSRNSRLMLNYGGKTPDGRVYLGRGGGTIAYDAHIGPEFDYSPKQAREIEADFRYLYPELRDIPITRAWAGPIDRSTIGLPWFGQLGDDRIHYAIGFAGHGVSATAIAGRAIAARLVGRSDDWTAAAACLWGARQGSFPPEPIRYIGGHFVRAAVLRKELAENAGRAPSTIDTRLAAFAPATVADIGARR
jgi:glycine/D-amino acid oxidase-like deaminating enzyme